MSARRHGFWLRNLLKNNGLFGVTKVAAALHQRGICPSPQTNDHRGNKPIPQKAALVYARPKVGIAQNRKRLFLPGPIV